MDTLLLNMLSHPWSMAQEHIDIMCRVLARRYVGIRADFTEISAAAAARGAPYTAGVVGIMPLTGMLIPRGNILVDMSGATSLEMWGKAFMTLVNDDEVKAIVIDVDSPGGNHANVPETALMVRQARSVKPIVAVSNFLNASAAYFIASQAHQVVGAESSVTGSIGVFTIHQNLQAALEMEGIEVTTIFAGKYKTELHPTHPLSAEAKAFVQSQVDLCYRQFVAAVAAGRGVTREAVRSGYGQGRALCADDALAAGLLDRIATLEETVKRLQSPQARGAVRISDESIQSPQKDPVDGAKLAAAVAERFDSAGAEPPDAPD